MIFLKNISIRYNNFKRKYVVRERREQEYFINRYYAHIIDPFFTKLVYDLRLTPNMVTVVAGLLGIGAACAIGLGYLILGAILLQLHHLFDGADGNLARMLNKCTPLGAKLDKFFDQAVRLILFSALALSVDVPLWIRIALIITIYFDIYIVHNYVLPRMREGKIVRSKWKLWFLKKGIIPGFDIFTIFFLISIFALFNRLDIAVYVILIGKNIDWLYRVWEVSELRLKKRTWN